MRKIVVVLILVVAVAIIWYVFVREEPGSAEQLGREIDETIEKIKYGDETTMEKAGRKTKEAIDDVKEEMKE